MILVTGATGHLGAAVVEHLLQHLPASQIAVAVQKPNEAHALAEKGVAVRHGDFDEPDDLVRSFDGADRLLLISARGIDHEGRAAQHRRAIDAAKRAGVGHVYYTSLLPGDDSVAHVMKAHLDTEAYLKASGLRCTILKNGVYAEAWPQYLGSSGAAVVPADGPVSWVARADLAEGTAQLLCEGGQAGQTLRLTGPAPLTLKDTAGLLNRALRIGPVEDFVSARRSEGASEAFARQWAATYFGLARGEFGAVDPLLGALLGRPLRTMAEFLKAPG